jgi:hypothetical protein
MSECGYNVVNMPIVEAHYTGESMLGEIREQYPEDLIPGLRPTRA